MMSETLKSVAIDVDHKQLAEQLLAQAKEQGVELVGPNGLLNELTKNVLETALDAEMTEHLGYDKHDAAGRGSGNSRNGTRSKTVFTEIGRVELDVPRDTNSTVDPVLVRKRQRRLTGIDEIVLSLTAKGLTTGEIAAHCDDVYGATVCKDTISRITDKVIEEMADWCNRPLESVYPVVFIDAVFVKVRDGQVANRPLYVAIGVTCAGERDILGCGPAAAVRVRSSGSQCSLRSRTAALSMCASWSATASKGCPRRSMRCGRGRWSGGV